MKETKIQGIYLAIQYGMQTQERFFSYADTSKWSYELYTNTEKITVTLPCHQKIYGWGNPKCECRKNNRDLEGFLILIFTVQFVFFHTNAIRKIELNWKTMNDRKLLSATKVGKYMKDGALSTKRRSFCLHAK